MSKKIQFSIVLPTYNRCYILWRAILSVIKQTYPWWELIIIDDDSTDDTRKLVEQFTDPRIFYYKNNKNKGPAAARNLGLKKAKNGYIAYLDSDNKWHEDYLETVVKTFIKFPKKKVCFCKKNYRLILTGTKKGNKVLLRDEFTNHRKYFDLKRLWQRKIIIDTNTMVHKKEVLKVVGKWDEKLDFWEDFELTLRISQKYPNSFIYINRCLVDYEQIINLQEKDKIFKKWENAEKRIFQKHKNHPLINEQNWYPSQTGFKSTENVIKYLNTKKQ